MSWLSRLFGRSAPRASAGAASRFVPGQRYALRGWTSDPGASMVILRVEHDGRLGAIVHVSIEDVKIPSPNAPGGFTNRVGHLPMAEAAVEESVGALLGEGTPLPDFMAGYQQWREAFDQGNAGVFTVPAHEILEGIIGAMRGA